MRYSGRRCIPPGGVARRFHTPGVRAPRALPGGRLDAHRQRTYFPELVGIAVLLRKVRREPRLRRLLQRFAIVTVVALSGLAANVLHDAIPPLAHRPGLAQRLGFAGYFLWFVSVSVWNRDVNDGTDGLRL